MTLTKDRKTVVTDKFELVLIQYDWERYVFHGDAVCRAREKNCCKESDAYDFFSQAGEFPPEWNNLTINFLVGDNDDTVCSFSHTEKGGWHSCKRCCTLQGVFSSKDHFVRVISLP